MTSERIAIVGAGLMGHGIAQVFAAAGHPVALQDPDPDVLCSAPERIAANLEAVGGDPHVVANVELHAELGAAVGDAAFVFEAAPERLELKRDLFASLAELAPAEAVLASNSSVIPISEIALSIDSPERTVGTHWWNPPFLLPLVEVIQGTGTAEACVTRTMHLLRQAGKTPVHVLRDVPGFVGNRLQHALWREAIALVADGVCDAETVDAVVKASFGRRLAVMGPLENADYIGLDLTLDIHEQILHDLDVTAGPSPYLRRLVDEGRLGMTSGEGFRQWEPGDREQVRSRLLDHLRSSPEDP